MSLPPSTLVQRALVCGAIVLRSRFAEAECNPPRMVRTVYVHVGPEVDKASLAAQPKTLYRFGTKYARLEEAADVANGVHQLMVVNGPDVWLADLLNNEGTHFIDPGDRGAAFRFRAPLFIDTGGSAFLMSLEFGCEVASMKAAGAEGPTPVNLAGQTLDRYDVTRGAESIMLLAEPGTDLPYAVGFYRDGSTLFGIRYIEYSNTLAPNLTLFDRPGGITFTDGK